MVPNLVKYTPGILTGALGRNGIWLGVYNQGSYGQSSISGWWVGITPPLGGYTIYMYKSSIGSDGQSTYRPSSDSELVTTTWRISRSLGLSPTITTATEALSWIATQTNMICVNFDYNNVYTATDPLLLLDAGFTPGYPRTGSTWYDISVKGNHATLTNSPTFEYVDGTYSGSFKFNGSTHYAPVTSSLLNVTYTGKTIYAVVKADATGFTTGVAQFRCIFGSTSVRNFNLYLYKDAADLYYLHFSTTGAATVSSSSAALTPGSWCFIAVTQDSASTISYWVNGSVLSASQTGTLSQYSASDEAVGRGDNYWKGSIAIVQIYPKALSYQDLLLAQSAYDIQYRFFTYTTTISIRKQISGTQGSVTVQYSTNGSTWTTLTTMSLVTSYLTAGGITLDYGATLYFRFSTGSGTCIYGVGNGGPYSGYCLGIVGGNPYYQISATVNSTVYINIGCVDGSNYVYCA